MKGISRWLHLHCIFLSEDEDEEDDDDDDTEPPVKQQRRWLVDGVVNNYVNSRLLKAADA